MSSESKMLNETLMRSAMASKLAYAKSIKSVIHMPHMVQLHGRRNDDYRHIGLMHAKETGASAYTWNNGRNAWIIAFKGSDSIHDIMNLMKTKTIDFSFRDKVVGIHQGMYIMFQSIEHLITEQLIQNMTLNSNIYITFTGHSLGGALALLASAYYSNLSHKNIGISCHTFGSPKVGDNRFVEWLTDTSNDIVNVVNKGDIVPCYPFCGQYSELPNKIILDHDPLGDAFKQHDLDTYLDNMRKHSELMKVPFKRSM